MTRKSFLLLLLVGLVIGATVLPTVDLSAQEVRVSRNLDRKFKRDAARLTLRLQSDEDLRYQSIQISPTKMDEMYTALIGMYTESSDMRTVMRCNIHTRPNPSIDHMLVIFDREVEWAAPLREGRHETTSITFNDLLYEHDLIIEKHIQWDDTRDAVAVRSNKPLNMASLANEFYNLEGVQEIDLGLAKNKGNDIVATRTADAWRFEFKLSFGSLAEKGEKVHTWIYERKDNGEVNKISEGGDDIPEWMRCFKTEERILARG
jgi:hypothetical protein